MFALAAVVIGLYAFVLWLRGEWYVGVPLFVVLFIVTAGNPHLIGWFVTLLTLAPMTVRNWPRQAPKAARVGQSLAL